MTGPRLLGLEETRRQLEDLPGWARLGGRLHTRFDAPDVPAAVSFVGAAFEAAEELDHHPDVDVRWKRVAVRCSTHSAGGVTQLDVELAHRIEEAARAVGATHVEAQTTGYEIGIDTTDASRVAPFWAAVMGYRPSPDNPEWLEDPAGHGPPVWFQVTDGASTARNRLHVDVSVLPEQARPRIDAALAAGGRMVTEEFAPRWWVLADSDGNEVCVCTEDGRGM